MRDRLIELIRNADNDKNLGWYDLYDLCRGKGCAEYFADYLLANGVIVPPVSIGDSLWDIHYNKPREWKVVYLGFNGEEWHINVHWSNKDRFLTKEVDGKYLDRPFFRTKEEAEQALKEREKV